MIFEDNQTLVFIGDSITDCGRRDTHPPYGDGYVSVVHGIVTATYPDKNLTWINKGVGGDTVRDLQDRWQRDAVDPRPDWLSVMIGINDIWRNFDGKPDLAVPIHEYRTTLRQLLREAVSRTGCRLILAGPYIIEPDTSEKQRAASDEYDEAVRGLAAEFDAVYVPTQPAFDRVLAYSKPQDWSGDRIHPNLSGHAVIAKAFLDAIGAD